MDINKPTKALVFELNDELIDTVANKSKLDINSLLSPFKPKEVLVNNLERNIKHDISNLMNSSKPSLHKEPFLIDLYAQKLIYELLNSEHTKKAIGLQRSNPMDRVIQYMTNNMDQPFSSQEIADMFHMSVSNFSHTFKKYVGVSPQKYMNRLKIENSIRLLRDLSVTEVAFELGYENPSHFITLFKKHYGKTPKQYQLSLNSDGIN
jgi:AraC-like DNA-binding protein